MVKVKPPHSYLVDRRDGSVRKVHANKIRQFVVRVQGCGVIAGKDAEFGRVLTPVPVVSSVLPSQSRSRQAYSSERFQTYAAVSATG